MKYAALFPIVISSNYNGATATLQVPLQNDVPVYPCRLHLREGGNRLASLAAVTNPGGITTDAEGFVYIVESTGQWIHRISPDGAHHPTWAVKTETNVIARASYGLAVHQGYLYLSYSNSGRVVKIDLKNPSAGETTVISGVTGVFGLAIREGFLYLSSYYYGKVIRVPVTATDVTYKSPTHDYCRVSGARGICFDSNGSLYVAAYGAGIIFRYNRKGPPVPAITGLPPYLTDISINSQNELYVSFNATTEGIRKYTPDLLSYSSPYHPPQEAAASLIWGLSLTPTDTLLVGAYNSNEIFTVSQELVISPTIVRAQLGKRISSESFSAAACYPCTTGLVSPGETVENPALYVTAEPKQEQLLLWQ